MHRQTSAGNTYHLFLFNDMILITKWKRLVSHYKLKYSIPLLSLNSTGSEGMTYIEVTINNNR
jgi:hypothetical protein